MNQANLKLQRQENESRSNNSQSKKNKVVVSPELQKKREEQLEDMKRTSHQMHNNFSRDYEKKVNEMLKKQLKTGNRTVYFKTNNSFNIDSPTHCIHKEWRLFQKKPGTKDDVLSNKDKEIQEDKQNANLLPGNIQEIFGPIMHLEIDGMAYIPKANEHDTGVIIDIEGQVLQFTTPCLILIETTIVSDEVAVVNKLIQLMKDYVLARTEMSLFDSLTCNGGGESDGQYEEASKLQDQFKKGDIPVYLLCVTNNNKEEGRKSFKSAWNQIEQMFNLSKISYMFNKKNADAFNQDQFKKKHVKHLHIQSIKYGNFIANIDGFQTKIEGLEKDVSMIKGNMEDMKGQMEGMKGQMEGMKGQMNEMNGKITHMDSSFQKMMEMMEKLNKKVDNLSIPI